MTPESRAGAQINDQETAPPTPEVLPRTVVARLRRRLEENGIIPPLRKEDDPDGVTTIVSWADNNTLPTAEATNYFQKRLTPEGKELLSQTATDLDLDLKDHHDFLVALLSLPKPSPQKTEVIEGEALAPELDQPRALVPLGGDLLRRFQLTWALRDPETRQMTVEAFRERLEMVLVAMRSQNDQAKAEALRAQVAAVEGALTQYGKPVDWQAVFEKSLAAYYQANDVPKKKQFGLDTSEGLKLAVREGYVPVAAAVLAAPEAAGEKADGLLARVVENERAKLAQAKEKNRVRLTELQQANSERLELDRIRNQQAVAARFAETAPDLEKQEEAKRMIKRIQEAAKHDARRIAVKENVKLPLAALRGVVEECVEAAAENVEVAGTTTLGAIAGGAFVLVAGLPWPVWPLTMATAFVGGAALQGYRQSEKKNTKGLQ